MGLYLTAAQGDGAKGNPRRPKYLEQFGGVEWSAMDFGAAPVFLVGAPLAPATEATLDASADFFTVPSLDTLLSAGQVTALSVRLEPLGLPAQWISTSQTWRQVLRGLTAVFLLAQRADAALGQATLDQTLAQIPSAVRVRLQDAATSLGFSLTGITGATTVRQALRQIAAQWPTPIALGEATL